MLTHGHGDGAYAHYSTALWPADSNFTISSLYRVLRALERAPVKQSKELFQAPPQNSFFDALLHGKSRCSSSIPSSEGCDDVPSPPPGRPAVPLPYVLAYVLADLMKAFMDSQKSAVFIPELV
jgi:hypothetical protein